MVTRDQFKGFLRRPLVLVGLALVAAGVLVVLLANTLPPGIDWHDTFRPAALEVLAGRSPYRNPGFVYPAWAILPMLPLALLSEQIGRAILFLISAAALIIVAYRMGARPLALCMFLLSPPVLHELLNANIDWLGLIGLVLPPQLGLFFVVIKPQIGSAVALWWLIEAWRDGGAKEVIRVFAPVTIALSLTFLLFGFWPLAYLERVDYWWNASLWPASIPVGLALIVSAIRHRDIRFAAAASPCLSPYVLLHSWTGALVAVIRNQWEFLAAVVGLWILVIIRLGETGF